jgi:hypothetical protein
MRLRNLLQYAFYLTAVVICFSCNKADNGVTPLDNQPVRTTPLAKSTQPTPFNGTITYQLAQTPMGCNCVNSGPGMTLQGTGNLTHLGSITSTIQPCIGAPDPNNPLVLPVVSECATLFAANGDELYTTTGAYGITINPANGTMSASIPVTFNGGTGRFAGAAGGFTGALFVDAAGVSTLTISGSIHY